MARIRTIKPELFHHEGLCDLPIETRYLFMGMLCHADRAGRLPDRPRRIKAQVLPYEDITPAQVDEMLEALASHPEAFLLRYEVDGEKVIQITSFLRHQRPTEKEPQSDLPAHPDYRTRLKANRQGDAVEFLEVALAGGSRNPTELKQEAEGAGIPERTLDRARHLIGVVSVPDPTNGRRKLWQLSDDPDVRQKIPAIGAPNVRQTPAKRAPTSEGSKKTSCDNSDLQHPPRCTPNVPKTCARPAGKGREELPSRYYLPSNFKEKEKKIENGSETFTEDELDSLFGKRRPARATSGGAA